jgi:hypothetical protein
MQILHRRLFALVVCFQTSAADVLVREKHLRLEPPGGELGSINSVEQVGALQ